MNWFDTSGLTNLAKNALKEAQKTIDKALDIQDEDIEEQSKDSPSHSKSKLSSDTETPQKDSSDFFASWGLTVSAERANDETITDQKVVTESPSKSNNQSLWGSFAGSFFEPPKTEAESTIIRPPKAKSLNVITDTNYGSSDDLFSKSQQSMTDSDEVGDIKKNKGDNNVSKIEERRDSSRSNRLSLVSSRNSSDSVEILSQSLKTTPDSEASVHSMSHSSSAGQKITSESVEILPDSLVSPSSIECLGFDSYSSSSTSSNLSPEALCDKKSTPVGDRTDHTIETGDSVSLVADEDEDTISYNSISECTAPTVLDTDEKLSVSPNVRSVKSIEPQKKLVEKDFMHLDQTLITHKMQISESSSNDGSWSDRTLHADNDSMILDATLEGQCRPKEPSETEDIIIDKLSDSSSFYDVRVTANILQFDSSAFVNVEKGQCMPTNSNDSSQKDTSVKERTSPISSDSKSDLVKIGSDRTSGHTSGDELETATSSDIEIIPSPNGENHGFSHNSPAKYPFKQSKVDGSTSPNLVDLVLGKSLATKIRGHNRELSETSVQSNTSDESHGSEVDRLMRRLSEMAEVLDTRERRLLEISQNNAELAENNEELKRQVESLLVKHEGTDIINEDYTQRMSALEKKFQQAIREKDQLRKQLDSAKIESTRKNSSELENLLKEKDEVISQLQEEGEKLSRQQLQHSNIIKKLRAKERDNETVIKSLRDKISDQAAEVDRLKRSVAAKEELEVDQIEAVYRLTTANKKLETELAETKSALDDTTQKTETMRTSLEAARRELAELQRAAGELRRRGEAHAQLQGERESVERENESLRGQLQRLRVERAAEEKRWIARAEGLRRELTSAREQAAALEAGGGGAGSAGGGAGAGALLAQLAALQRSAVQRDQAHAHHSERLNARLAETETALAKAAERERLAREETTAVRERLEACEAELEETRGAARAAGAALDSKTGEWESLLLRVEGLEGELRTERGRHTAPRAVTPPPSSPPPSSPPPSSPPPVTDGQEPSPSRSESLSLSLWHPGRRPPAPSVCAEEAVEELRAALARREGEARALADHNGRLAADRRALAATQAGLHRQYDALLLMYGEKEEQLAELRLDLQDVTQLYKAQLDELVALKRERHGHA